MYKVTIDAGEPRKFRSKLELDTFIEEMRNGGTLYAVIAIEDHMGKTTEHIKKIPDSVLEFLEKAELLEGSKLTPEAEFRTFAGSEIDWKVMLIANEIILRGEQEGQQIYHLSNRGKQFLKQYKKVKVQYKL